MASLGSSEVVSWAWSQALSQAKADQGSKAAPAHVAQWPRARQGTDELGRMCSLPGWGLCFEVWQRPFVLGDSLAVCRGVCFWPPTPTPCARLRFPTECPAACLWAHGADMLTFPPGADGGAVGKAHGDARRFHLRAEDAGSSLVIFGVCLCLCEKPPRPSLTGSPALSPLPPGRSLSPPLSPARPPPTGPLHVPWTPCYPGTPTVSLRSWAVSRAAVHTPSSFTEVWHS